MEKEVITDILGEEILPGCLIGYAAGTTMDIAIVSGISIREKRLNFFAKKVRAKYKKVLKDSDEFRNRKYKYPWKNIKSKSKSRGPGGPGYRGGPSPLSPYVRIVISKEFYAGQSWIQLDSGLTQSRILVIKNPLFHMDNQKIVNQIDVADLAKDDGLISKNYILGQPDTFKWEQCKW